MHSTKRRYIIVVMKTKHEVRNPDSDASVISRINKSEIPEDNSAKFDHKSIESYWRDVWNKIELDRTDLDSTDKPYYNLMMFPYPSAEGLHIGNMYAFTGSDIFGRYKRMQGYEVLEPIGLDGFGIHSENYALKVGRHPMDHAVRTEKRFYEQLASIGAMFDWSRTLETYDPEYYRHTQWLFVQMFKHGLAYRKEARVNWCPSCKTVLADEQVIDGKCERCGNSVIKRLLKQWFFRITAYAEKLLKHIPDLDWSQKVKTAQTSWIGKKEGIDITYHVVDEGGKQFGTISCFTTRPDTNFGATFVVIAPEHHFVTEIISNHNLKTGKTDVPGGVGTKTNRLTESERIAAISSYVETSVSRSDQDRMAEGRSKTGVFTGYYCLNSLNGTKIPIYISDFVLMSFGTGAVVGVPGHDERDYAFAAEFGLPVRKVVDFDHEAHVIVDKSYVTKSFPTAMRNNKWYFEDRKSIYAIVAPKTEASEVIRELQKHLSRPDGFAQADGCVSGIITSQGILTDNKTISEFFKKSKTTVRSCWPLDREKYPFCYTGEGKAVNSGFLDGLRTSEAIREIGKHIVDKGWGTVKTSYHLRDWLISRQRYWGPPIPMVFCQKCETDGKSWFTTPEARNYQHKAVTARNISDRTVGMDGWYPVSDAELPVTLPRIDDYKPADDGVAPLAKHEDFYNTGCPGCGGKAVRETDVSDTFLDSSWYFLRYPTVASLAAKSLPFDKEITRKWLPVHMYTGGAEHSVLHLLYSRFITKALHDWGYLDFDEPFSTFFAHGLVIKDGAKMSKSKGNVVNPDEYIDTYGCDALRLYLMFMGPFDLGGDFRDTAMEGMSRWVGRVWRMANASLDRQDNTHDSERFGKSIAMLVKKVTHDMERRRYNTSIAAMMEFTNEVYARGGTLPLGVLKTFLLILAPLAPYLAEELWQKIHGQSNLSQRNESVHRQQWPTYREADLVESTVRILVQVNGKLRDKLDIPLPKSENQEYISGLALARETVSRHVPGKPRKTIFVKGKLVNFVV